MTTTSFEIAQREPVLGGRPFAEAGAYEKIAGTLRFAVDPRHPDHADIVDLDRAPRNAAGLVEFSADFCLLRPVEAARGNGALLLDVPNRGRKVALGMLNSTVRVPDPTTAADFGNGFLMRHGYTVAWVGWQADVPRVDGLMALDAPIARGITGPMRCEFRPNLAAARLPMADRYHVPQPTIALDDPEARLTVRERIGVEAAAVPRARWRFADATHIEIDGGFQPGHVYELVYRAQDPAVIGAGLLAVRDAGAWLRFGGPDSGNPCAGALARAYVLGVSQTGRFLRDFLYLGLSRDERGRRVFDAILPHVASARRGEFNVRFGQPSLNARQSIGGLFPFTGVEQVDPLTGARGSLFARQAARGGLPKIVSTNTAAEYWQGDGSLVHTDVEARADVDSVPEARVYLFAGCQHSPGTLPPPDADVNTGGRGLQRFNVVDYAPLLRAVLVNVDAWVRDGVAPPPSAVPRIADGTAVPAESTEKTFTAIPGARFPDQIQRPVRLDFGPDAARGICTTLPPKVGAPYATLVSAVDADGNEVAGIRAAELRVPLATFTGWNPRHPDQGAPGDLMAMMGSTLPFCRDADERARLGDPRASIAERYASRDDYLARVRAACRELVGSRHMLAEDVDAVVARAGRLYDWVQAGA
jgi:Alpha/beta hydrolase domain